MKKILPILAAFMGVTTGGYAADLPAKAPAVPAVFNWTGCYLGVEGGASRGRSQQVAAASANAGLPINGGFNVNGILAGGTGGCNLQVNNVVFGLEDDFSWANARGSANDLAPFDTTAVNETREKWLNTLRVRIGYAFDRFLVYGTAGAALAGTEVRVSSPRIGLVIDQRDRSGWVAGAGAEWAAWSASWADVTFRLEYLHAGYEAARYFDPSIIVGNSLVVTRNTPLSEDIVRAGVNLKFNWGSSAVAAGGSSSTVTPKQ
jgi:outer membrane immunogenic protein